MKIVINEYAEHRSRALLNWFPDAIVCERYKGKRTPLSFDLLVLSGGPDSADRESRRKRPYLNEDMQLIRDLSVDREGAPFVLGICLGAQLMSFAFGGAVTTGAEVAIGWNEIRIVSEHPAFKGIKRTLQCEIHRNHITKLPNGATVLATSRLDAVEAFSIGTRFLGTAYHPEFTVRDIKWFRENTSLDLGHVLASASMALTNRSIASARFFENIRKLVSHGPA